MKTDLQLRQDVLNELEWEPSVNAANINVEAKEGAITLAGHVDTFAEKRRAEDATQRVSGVKALAVKIDVKLLTRTERTDADIAKSAENVVRWSNDLYNNSVTIMVNSGWVTLTGFVGWEFQKRNIGYALCNLMGVVGLSNQLAIKPKVKGAIVKGDIEQALKRCAVEGLKHVAIHINDSEITLSGYVDSWTEREVANHSAWNTPGVKSVINQIKIA
ncbi:BON domain-containing protein [Methylophilus sp. OH31]|uniref:BON domain-containing protein n=1 Tax=Methylophilus sp. OH31 TaxID=1387312 RepID=UPI0004661700|nr:BON domain-containing protein [Methylophilus sp. OH31]